MACDICGGTGRISLRVRSDDPPSMVERSRRYPCPECQVKRTVDAKRMTVLRFNEVVSSKFANDSGVIENRKARLAQSIARTLVQRKLALMSQRPGTAPGSIVLEMAVALIRPKGVKDAREIQQVEDDNLPPLPEEFRPEQPAVKPGVRHLIFD